MFCRMPVICMMVNGMPIHRLTTITVTRAHMVSVKNGSGLSTHPQDISRRLMAPSGWSIWLMTSSETNCGTAIDSENAARQKPLSRVVRRLMIIARNRPRKKFRNVAKNAQIRVQANTLPNWAALISPVALNSWVKFLKPTQSNSST